MFYWTYTDTAIVLTASIAAAACAIPGCFLFLRKQSMIADALTHAALPGVVVAFVLAGYLETAGLLSHEGGWMARQTLIFVGATGAGVLTAFLTDWVSRTGWIRGDAAMGVVFTTLFAIGLLLMRQFADKSDVDLDCVLYGQLETVTDDGGLPAEAISCGFMLIANLVMVALCFKELMITTFDPELAGALGFRPRAVHYGLMTVTTATLVTAFEVVGSILVIGMLVIPAATAFFVVRQLKPMIAIAMLVAVSSSILGHIAAITLPAPIMSAVGFVNDSGDPLLYSVKTSGSIILVAATHLFLAILVGPERGVLVEKFKLRKLASP